MALQQISLFLFLLSALHCQAAVKTDGTGAVASPDSYGAATAEQVLRQGGNAVDAAIATAFTLAVTYPEAGNIGGGGFMTLWFEGKPYFLDYRETAPGKAHRDMYLDADKQLIPDLSLIGHKASGVPGTVMGLWQAHQRFGSLPWRELVMPAIHYAKTGFTVAENQYQYRADLLQQLEGKTNFSRYFGAMQAGKLFVQPELANTLERIAEHGPQDFYHGKTAELLVAQMQRGGGLISLDDLAAYKAGWREPVITPWREFNLITTAPPSSGGIALSQLLGLKLRRAADFNNVALNSTQYVHLIAEIEKVSKKLMLINSSSPMYSQLLGMLDIAQTAMAEHSYVRRVGDKRDSIIEIGTVEEHITTPDYSSDELLLAVVEQYTGKKT